MTDPRRPFPWPQFTIRELLGMVLVFALCNGAFIWGIRQLPAAGRGFEKKTPFLLLLVNLTFLTPLAMAIAVRWLGDVARFVRPKEADRGEPLPQNDLVVRVEITEISFLAGFFIASAFSHALSIGCPNESHRAGVVAFVLSTFLLQRLLFSLCGVRRRRLKTKDQTAP
jgi:hypothetical protein